ncbi:SPW repeat protein [Halocatena salina]|uniref:SPW repeat protein n=1 Tax=Halocatena salina TaxID=2934340 RepID=A0A8U0A0V0_9EURY|nr:SPW repeat protein [Halocatena salina]UPM42781.1 SPW repeat protein [Halocatena salina]
MSKTAAQTTPDGTTERGMKWFSGVTAVLGLWIAVSSFVFTGMSQASYWNNIVIGVSILLIAGYNTYRLMNGMSASVASAGLVTILGLWMILAPFVLDTSLMMLLWSDIIAGALVVILAGYNTYMERKTQQTMATGT